MSHRRVNKRTGVAAAAGAAVVAAAAIILPNANASGDRSGPRESSPRKAAQLGRALASDLGDRTAGWYVEGEDGKLVMNVMDERTAEEVRTKGAVARIVKNSMAELEAATQKLSDDASVPGTAWSIDPKTNQVSVLADRRVTGRAMAQLRKSTDAMPGLVSVKRSAGEFRLFTGQNAGADSGGGQDAGADSGGAGAGGGEGEQAGGRVDGGDAIFGGGSRCSLGFNVEFNGEPAFLTAGHCGNASQTWSADQDGAQPLGTVVESVFPGSDFALVKYDDANTEASSTVDLKNTGDQEAEIAQAAEANVGMRVQRSGSTTGLSEGAVTGLNATVNYGDADGDGQDDIVDGLIQTNVCAEPGDSGGAMFSGDLAVGLTSGGSGDCTQGGETFFQPVTQALQETGAQLGAGGAADGAGEDAGSAGEEAGGAGEEAGGAGEDAGGANLNAGAGEDAEADGGQDASGGHQAGNGVKVRGRNPLG